MTQMFFNSLVLCHSPESPPERAQGRGSHVVLGDCGLYGHRQRFRHVCQGTARVHRKIFAKITRTSRKYICHKNISDEYILCNIIKFLLSILTCHVIKTSFALHLNVKAVVYQILKMCSAV